MAERELDTLGLSGNEARVLLAVLRLGTANSIEAARESKVARTNVYRVLEDLGRRRLVERVPGDGPAAWTSPGLEEVIDRLHLDQEERLRAERAEQVERAAALHAEQQRQLHELQVAHDQRIAELGARVASVRQILSGLTADQAAVLPPKVQLIPTAAQLTRTYEQLLSTVRSELLVLVRPPYAASPGTPKAPILEALARGVQSRVLYEAAQFEAGPEAEGFRREMEAYHRAGVGARIVDALPVKMAVFDRAAALIALMDGAPADNAYPSFLLVEHEGFATYQAEAFDYRWAGGRPYETSVATTGNVNVNVNGKAAADADGQP